MANPYYHVTHLAHAVSIQQYGLKCNEEGYIYLFDTALAAVKNQYGGHTTVHVPDFIASGQLGLAKYALFEVGSVGLDVVPEPDLVGESTARFQWRVRQAQIPPAHVRLLWTASVNYAQLRRVQAAMSGLTVKQLNQLQKVGPGRG